MTSPRATGQVASSERRATDRTERTGRPERTRITNIALLVIALLLGGLAVLPAAGAGSGDEPVSIWRVYVQDQDDIAALTNGGYDLVEARGDDYLLVVGREDLAARLEADGFRVELDKVLSPITPFGPDADQGNPDAAGLAAYYGGYRSTVEHYEHLAQVAADHPELAMVVDYGDSWLKTEGRGGHELLAICLTRRQPGDCERNPDAPKPRAVIMAAIHARELQTAELAWRLIDELTDNYDSDPDLTHMMDTVETWIIPVANPDGREIVESGGNAPHMHRKNANDSAGDCESPGSGFNHFGVDLNRNASYNWSYVGSSAHPCVQTYHGVGPASEPEQQALESLFLDLWGDRFDFDPDGDDWADLDIDGTFITIHSYGEMILVPGGRYDPPNDIELRPFAARMSRYNNYQTGVGYEILYEVSGSTDEFVYFDLGVPAFTYEVSPRWGDCSGFDPDYSCVDSVIWPLNRDALLYSIKVAAAPYKRPLGPTINDATATESVRAGSPVTVTATADDYYGEKGVNLPRPASITKARVFVDGLPGSGVKPIAMTASDGSFSSPEEAITGRIDTTGMTNGRHMAYVQARNADGHWGAITATWFEVTDGTDPGDVDADGDQDADDVVALLQALVDQSLVGPVGDIDGDHIVALPDAHALAKLINTN